MADTMENQGKNAQNYDVQPFSLLMVGVFKGCDPFGTPWKESPRIKNFRLCVSELPQTKNGKVAKHILAMKADQK